MAIRRFGMGLVGVPLGGATLLVFLGPVVLGAYNAVLAAVDASPRKAAPALGRHVTRVLSAIYIGLLVTHTMTFAADVYYAVSLALAITNPSGGSSSAARQLAQDIYNTEQGYAILVFVFMGATAVLDIITVIMAGVALARVQARVYTGSTRMTPTVLSAAPAAASMPSPLATLTRRAQTHARDHEGGTMT